MFYVSLLHTCVYVCRTCFSSGFFSDSDVGDCIPDDVLMDMVPPVGVFCILLTLTAV